MLRAVLDVNVIISAVIAPRGAPRLALEAWQQGRFGLVTSEGIIAQVREKLSGPKIGGTYGIGEADIRWVVALLRTQAEVVAVLPECLRGAVADPEDDYVLATGVAAGADCLVTGDRGLLTLDRHEGMAILTPRAFLDLLAQQEQP